MALSPRPAAPPRKPWKRRSAARPEELRQAALTLFAERGYAATSIEDIAAAASVTVGTVYRYFRDKAALLSDLVRHALERPFLPPATIAEARAQPTAADQFRHLHQALWQAARRDPHGGVLRILVGDGASFPDLASDYRTRVLDPLVLEVARAFEGLLPGSDPALTARAVVSQVLGASLLAGTSRGSNPLLVQLEPAGVSNQQLLTQLAGAERSDSPKPARSTTRTPSQRRTLGPDAW